MPQSFLQNDIYQRPARPQRRVVVTGIGLVSPLGLNLNETWKALIKGESGIGPITQFDTSKHDVKFAGEVKNFDPSLYIEKKEQKKMDRFIHFSLACAEMALKDSGLELTEKIKERTGSIVGVGLGGLGAIENNFSILTERGPSRVTPFFVPMVITNMASGNITIKYGLKGVNYSVTSACSSGAHSIGEAANYIRSGLADVMLAGGAESTICPLAVAGFSSMRALSTRNDQPKMASRPFDKGRDGFVIAEAAAILVLEDYEFAAKRGARIYGEVSGYGASSDAHHMTNPAPGGVGAALAMGNALRDAGLNANEISYVNAHGTSTPAGDGIETQALHRTFGDHSKKLWVSSTKSMTGHSLGAAGALESAFTLMTLSEGIAPPTINLENPSEDCDLDYIPNTAREGKFKHVANNSFGFGGTNACLVFSKI